MFDDQTLDDHSAWFENYFPEHPSPPAPVPFDHSGLANSTSDSPRNESATDRQVMKAASTLMAEHSQDPSSASADYMGTALEEGVHDAAWIAQPEQRFVADTSWSETISLLEIGFPDVIVAAPAQASGFLQAGEFRSRTKGTYSKAPNRDSSRSGHAACWKPPASFRG